MRFAQNLHGAAECMIKSLSKSGNKLKRTIIKFIELGISFAFDF